MGIPIADTLMVVLIGAGVLMLILILGWPNLMRHGRFRGAALLVMATAVLYIWAWLGSYLPESWYT